MPKLYQQLLWIVAHIVLDISAYVVVLYGTHTAREIIVW